MKKEKKTKRSMTHNMTSRSFRKPRGHRISSINNINFNLNSVNAIIFLFIISLMLFSTFIVLASNVGAATCSLTITPLDENGKSMSGTPTIEVGQTLKLKVSIASPPNDGCVVSINNDINAGGEVTSLKGHSYFFLDGLIGVNGDESKIVTVNGSHEGTAKITASSSACNCKSPPLEITVTPPKKEKGKTCQIKITPKDGKTTSVEVEKKLDLTVSISGLPDNVDGCDVLFKDTVNDGMITFDENPKTIKKGKTGETVTIKGLKKGNVEITASGTGDCKKCETEEPFEITVKPGEAPPAPEESLCHKTYGDYHCQEKELSELEKEGYICIQGEKCGGNKDKPCCGKNSKNPFCCNPVCPDPNFWAPAAWCDGGTPIPKGPGELTTIKGKEIVCCSGLKEIVKSGLEGKKEKDITPLLEKEGIEKGSTIIADKIINKLNPEAPKNPTPEKEKRDLWSRLLCKNTTSVSKTEAEIECWVDRFSIFYGVVSAGRMLWFRGEDAKYGTCSAEKPLPGTSYCTTCNDNPYMICTKERCEILGKCIAISEDNKNYRCYPGTCEEGDINLTEIDVKWYTPNNESELVIAKDNDNNDKDSGSGVIRLNIPKLLPYDTKNILINVSTDKVAQCRYIIDKAGSNFSDMIDFDDNYYPETIVNGKKHSKPQLAMINLPGTLARDSNHTIYIKCNNVCNLPHAPSYDFNQVRFRFNKKPDQLPPNIIFVDPKTNSFIRETDHVNASFWLDESGFCKFSDKTDNYTINYSDMHDFSGSGGGYNPDSSVTSGGCGDTKCIDRNETCSMCWLNLDLSNGYESLNWSMLPSDIQDQLESNGLGNSTKLFRFRIRCEDTPAGNVMPEEDTFEYSFMTLPGFNINITKPPFDDKYERQPEIEVETGKRLSECHYNISERISKTKCEEMNFTNMLPIDDGFDTVHKGRTYELNVGKHDLCVKCRDQWGIESYNTSNFTILEDKTAPKAIRIYHDNAIGDYLIVETDEPSVCVYGSKDEIGCNYDFSDGTEMTGNNELIHSAYWQTENNYYIKCKDKWGNKPTTGCTVIVSPYEVPVL